MKITKRVAGLLLFFNSICLSTVLGPALGTALAAPAEIIFIRHGEKPESGPDLNERGYARAEALVNYFQTNTQVTRFGTPAAIFAMKSKGDEDSSNRPVETVTPLAKALSLPVQAEYTKNHLNKLLKQILKDSSLDGKMVVICWEHKVISDVVNDLGLDGVPSKWPGSSFDRSWVIDFDSAGNPTQFQNIPQKILPGDSEK